jgi:acyl carrier protein
MSTFETIQDILVSKFALDRATITPDAGLDRLGIDSLAVLEMLFEIEDRFGLKIKEDTPNYLATIQDVVIYIDSLLSKREAQESAAALSTPE